MIDPETFAQFQMELTAEFARYILEHPEVDNALPQDSYVFFQVEARRSSTSTVATSASDANARME